MRLQYLILVVCFLTLAATPLIAQSVGDYRSAVTAGNWNSAASWQRWNGTNWAIPGAAPTGSEFITIQGTDSINVNVATTITGTLKNQGKIGGADNLTIGDGGTFEHAQDAGSLPFATWGTGSTLLITGTTGTAPANRNQSFHHVVFNTPNNLANLNMGLDDVTIGGNVTVVSSGSGRWYLTTALAGDTAVVTIKGDVIVQGGAFSVHGTGNANTTFIVYHDGDINVTGGNFAISRGSQPNGTTTWHLREGNFSATNATTQNSNATAGNAKFVFTKQGGQELSLSNITFADSRGWPIEVAEGTTLSLGTTAVGTSWWFVVRNGAGLATGHSGGVGGALSGVTNVSLSTEANYTFNGTEAQVTSTLMPATVNNLRIANTAGVTLSQQTTINGVLTLRAGEFNNDIPFTLGPSGSISYEGGSLKNPIVSVETTENGVPKSFYVAQNFPNPFNPSTMIRFGLPQAKQVSIKVYNLVGQTVATLFDGRKEAGTHELRFDASSLTSGVYLLRVQAGNSVSVRQMILLK
jgi:hypothetical protein